MSEQRFTLTPGQVTPLTGALAAGSTIINTDTTAAVWVSASPNVAPGLGVRLGPKGSTSWTTDGAPVYACPDNGIVVPVAVTVSTDMAPPVNPVDVGVAVATQLLAQGIPSVLVGEEIPFANLGTPVDVSGYASITVRVFVNGPGILFYEYSTDLAAWDVIGSRTFVVSEPSYVYFTTDVQGPFFKLGAGGGATLGSGTTARFYGTNRSLGEHVLNVTTTAYADPNQAWTNGVLADLGMPVMTNGGSHRVRLAVTGSAKGFLYVTAYDTVTAAMKNISVMDTGMGHVSPAGAGTITECQDDIILPAGLLGFSFYPSTTATYQVVASVIPTH